MKRKKLYVVLAVAGALALVLAGLGGIAVVSAQEETTGCEGGLSHGIWGWGRDLFGFGRGGEWTMFDTVAEELDMTPEQLFSKLHDGESLEGIAEDKGVDLEVIREALNAARNQAMQEAIKQAVAEGDMSEEQADWLREGLEKGYMPGRGFGGSLGRPSHGPGMRGGFDRRDPKSDSSDRQGGFGTSGRQS